MSLPAEVVGAISESGATAALLLVLGALVAVSVLASRLVNRLGVPLVLLFLGLGMLGGSQGIGGIAFDNYRFASRLGIAALVLIFRFRSFREVMARGREHRRSETVAAGET